MRPPGTVFDGRALNLSRVGFALVLFFSLLEWSLDFEVFLSPKGVLPVEALVADTLSGRNGWSLYHALPLAYWPALVLLLCTFLGSLLMGVGWRPRATATWTFLATLSLHNRCSWALEEPDALLLLGLFAVLWVSHSERAEVRPVWSTSWFLMLLSLGVWAVDIVLEWNHLSLGLRAGSIVAPLLLIWCRNSYQRHALLAVVLLLFAMIHPWEWRLGLVFCCWLSPWIWFSNRPESVASQTPRPGPWVALAAVLLIVFMAPGDSARFWGLGPRAQVVSREVWFTLVGVTSGGERWDLDTGEEPTFEWQEDRFLRRSHRRRLFLGTLSSGAEPELPYWLALSFLRSERAREGRRPVRVEVYRCRKGESPHLVGAWPAQRY